MRCPTSSHMASGSSRLFPAFDRKIAEVDPVGGERQFFFYAAAEQSPRASIGVDWRQSARRSRKTSSTRQSGRFTWPAATHAGTRIELPRGVRPQHRSEPAVAGLRQACPPHGCRLVPHGHAASRAILRSISRPQRAVVVTNQHASKTFARERRQPDRLRRLEHRRPEARDCRGGDPHR